MIQLAKQERLAKFQPFLKISFFSTLGATLRHNEVRNITSELLDEVCVAVRKEPILQEATV